VRSRRSEVRWPFPRGVASVAISSLVWIAPSAAASGACGLQAAVSRSIALVVGLPRRGARRFVTRPLLTTRDVLPPALTHTRRSSRHTWGRRRTRDWRQRQWAADLLQALLLAGLLPDVEREAPATEIVIGAGSQRRLERLDDDAVWALAGAQFLWFSGEKAAAFAAGHIRLVSLLQ
jgi:hypothetical protein